MNYFYIYIHGAKHRKQIPEWIQGILENNKQIDSRNVPRAGQSLTLVDLHHRVGNQPHTPSKGLKARRKFMQRAHPACGKFSDREDLFWVNTK